MAVAGPLTVSSDEVYTYECIPCQEDGKVVEGIAFCRNCREFLCCNCLKVHKWIKASKSHNILEGSAISQADKYYTRLQLDTCERHKDNFSEFFCSGHSELVCGLCKAVDHVDCKDVKSIESASQAVQPSQDTVSNCLQESAMLVKKLQLLEKERNVDLRQLADQRKSLLTEIRSLRKEINDLFDELETDICSNVNKITDVESKVIEKHVSTLGSSIHRLERDAVSLRAASSLGGHQQVFLRIQQKGLEKMEQLHDKLQQERYKVELEFEVTPCLTDLLVHLTQLGQLVVRRQSTAATSAREGSESEVGSSADKPLRDKTIEVTETVKCDVREADDKHQCWVTGAVFCDDGQLLVCDYFNTKLKLFDNELKLLSSLSMPGQPYTVAMVTPQEAVVTVPNKRQLQFVSVKPALKLGTSISTGKACRGVAVHDGTLLVSCHENIGDGEVVVMDMQGGCRRRIGVNSDGTYQFQCPDNVAVDVEGRLYVSDNASHQVTCLDMEGQTIYTYSDQALQEPRDLLVDSSQNVYVCGTASSSVQVVSAAGHKVRTLVTSGSGLKQPYTLAYRSADGTLVVGIFGNALLSFRFL